MKYILFVTDEARQKQFFGPMVLNQVCRLAENFLRAGLVVTVIPDEEEDDE